MDVCNLGPGTGSVKTWTLARGFAVLARVPVGDELAKQLLADFGLDSRPQLALLMRIGHHPSVPALL